MPLFYAGRKGASLEHAALGDETMADAEEKTSWWDKVSAIATVAAVIIAILAIIVSIYLYWKQQESKELTYSIVSQTALLEVTNDAAYRDKIQVLYDGNEVEELTLYIIEINNSGTAPITVPAEFTDLERPINVSFGVGTRVFGANPSGFSPQNLRVSLRIKDNTIVVNPVLLNPDSKFTLEILAEGNTKPTIDWWLSVIKEVKEVAEQKDNPLRTLIWSIAGGLSGLILGWLISMFVIYRLRKRTPPSN